MTRETRPARILVVDDEPELLAALCEALDGEDYESVGCAGPAEALGVLRTGGFDLVLSDVMMPGGSGIDLAREARRPNPDLAVLLMTGQWSDRVEAEALAAGARALLRKPIRLANLRVAVGESLGAPQAAAPAR